MENEMDVMEIINEAENKFADALSKLPRVYTKDMGLDARSGRVWVDEDNGYIITNKLYRNALMRYGGFEYVHKDSITEFAGYVIFSDDDERVYNAIDAWDDNGKPVVGA